MLKTLGMLELNSIVRGIACADRMAKTASVRLMQARPVCPGKYVVMVAGDIGAVSSAMEAGREEGGGFVIDELFLPRLHPQVVEAIAPAGDAPLGEALGGMEFFSLAAAISAADTAVKAADVRLLEIRLGIGVGGKSFVTLTGGVAPVEEAVRAGRHRAEEEGLLVDAVVLTSLGQDIRPFLL